MPFIIIPVFYADFLKVRKTHYVDSVEIFEFPSYLMGIDYWDGFNKVNIRYMDDCFNFYST